MDTLQVNNENRRRKKSDERRSSILKTDRPTLADLDVNKKTETRISRRSSKRVSFAETYQVKEFPKDSPQRWLRDLHNADNELEENSFDDKKNTGGSEILGLDKLLNGPIQSRGQENENLNKTIMDGVEMEEMVCDNAPIRQNTMQSNSTVCGIDSDEDKNVEKVDSLSFLSSLNKTIMDGIDMEETVCCNASIRQNTTLSNTVCEVDSDEDKKVDSLLFLSNLMKKSQGGSDFEPFIKPQEDSDEEEYKASSIFKGGSKRFFSNSQTETDAKIDNKSFLTKLKCINTSSKQFSKEREQREKTENQTVVFDGLDADVEMTANFTATLQSFKKRPSKGSVLESTRIYDDTDNAMEMTRNLTSNLEVIKSNLPISEFDASNNVANVSDQCKLGTSMILGRSGNHGFDQTRVFSDYEDSTRGEILSNTAIAAAAEDPKCPNRAGVTTHITTQQTGPPAPEQTLPEKPEVPATCPEVTVHFSQQEMDADMEMTEALDPALVITNSNMDITRVKTTKQQLSKSSRALIDVTAHFEADGLTTRKEDHLTVGNRRKPSISPVDMGKENVTVHFRPVDVQSDMDVTLCLTAQLKSQDKEIVVITEQICPNDYSDKTKVFTDSEDVANMEFPPCIETKNTLTYIDDTISFKKKVNLAEKSEDFEYVVSCGKTTSVVKDVSGLINSDVTQMFGGGDVTAAMELTECHLTLPVNQLISEVKPHPVNQLTSEVKPHPSDILESIEDKTRVFDTGDATAGMDLTECAEVNIKRDSSEYKAEDRTVHFEKRGGSMELTACQTGLVYEGKAEDRTVHFEKRGGSMELTACQTGLVYEGKAEDRTVHFEKRGGSVELTACQTGLVYEGKAEDRTVHFEKRGGSMELTACQTGLVYEGKAEDRTVHFEKREGSMELTACQTGLVYEGKAEDRTVHFEKRGGSMELTACQTGLVYEGKAEDRTVHFEKRGGSMELTACQTGLVYEGKAENRTVHFEKQGGSMEVTACQTGLVYEGKAEDRTVHFEKRGGSMELTACQTGLVYEGKAEDRTVHFEKRGGSMELTACQTGLVYEGKAEDRTVHFEKRGGSMELTACQTGLVYEGKAEDRTVHFEKRGGSMELTACQTGLVYEGKAEDRTVHFEKQGGSMELTACQDGLVSVTASGKAEKTGISDATACKLSQLISDPGPNSVTKSECADTNPAKSQAESDKVEVPPLVKSRLSMPVRIDDPVQGQIAEANAVQQKRSYYGGITTSAPPVENFSTQSLKRKLYSFDMIMAGAKAKSVKTVKLKDSGETTDDSENINKTTPEKSVNSYLPALEKKQEMPNIKSEQKYSPKIEKEEEGLKTEIPERKISRSLSQEMSEHTDILKLGTSDQEVSALEVLKNLALEEDTLDDTKLLELRMLAKKNSGDRPAPIAESFCSSPQSTDHIKKTVGSDDVFTKTLDSEEQPHLPNDDGDDEDGNLTQYNTTTALAMMLSKMNRSKAAETALVMAKPSTESPVIQRTGSNLAGSKHGSPDPICSGNVKKPKLEDKPTVEKTEVCEDATLNTIEQPLEMKDNESVTSLDSTSPETHEDHTRTHQSQSAISLTQSLLSYSLLDKKYDETEGPWDFETFCERMGISQFRPKCFRRSSFNIQPAVEADSLHKMLQLQTVTLTETQVKGEMYSKLREQLDRDEDVIEEQQRSVVDNQPPLFNQLRDSEISQEEVHSCVKACHRWAKTKLKKERVKISKQCLKKLKVEKDRLCSGINEVVTKVEEIIAEIGSIDTMLADIDQQLEETEPEPMLTEVEAKEVSYLQERLHVKTEELKNTEEEKAEILCKLKEKHQKLKAVESEIQKQELQMLKEEESDDSGRRKKEDLEHKLQGLERVLEWRVKEHVPARDVFLFMYSALELSVTYDVVQHKTLDTVSLTSHLAACTAAAGTSLDPTSPWSHLVCRLIVDSVDCVKLRRRYPSRDKLPQMLHEISGLVGTARSLASEISQIDLRHRVSIHDYSVSVSLLNTRKVQKVVLTFMFEPGTFSCRPTDSSVHVVIGNIQKHKVEDILKDNLKSPQCLSKCINIVQNILDS